MVGRRLLPLRDIRAYLAAIVPFPETESPMPVTVIDPDAGTGALPPWLAAFERRELAPRERVSTPADGRIVLLYVLDGVLQIPHEASALDRALPGEVVCAAGIEALEFGNGSTSEALRVCEWAIPGAPVAQASVTQRYFSDDDKRGALCRVAAGERGAGALVHGGDGLAFLATLGKWETVLHNPASGASNWLHVFDGAVDVNGQDVAAGSSAWLRDEEEVRLSGREPASLLLLEGGGTRRGAAAAQARRDG